MFNIKFTFFALAKIMKVCVNLDIVGNVVELLFMKKSVNYSESWVTTAMMKPFDISKILDDQYFQIDRSEELYHNTFEGVNEFFINMLKSKD